MVQIVLADEAEFIHSPLYTFTSEMRDEPYTITLVKQATKEAYKPFSQNKLEGFVYFDFWSNAFSLQLKQLLTSHDIVNGVIRMRRTTTKTFAIEEDLLALSEAFGEVHHVTVRSNEKNGTRYTIVLCQLGEQIMAHFEYLSGTERIEFEWSSHQHIIEFDSLQMTGDTRNNVNLHKHVEAILAHAVVWDASYDQKLTTIQSLLQRGEQQ